MKKKKTNKNNELTDKQRAFCIEYVKDYNKKQAAIRAGYSERTADSQASQLLSKTKVLERIEYLKARTTERSLKTVEDLIEELQRIAFSDVTSYFTELTSSRMTIEDFKQLPREVTSAIKKVKMINRKGETLVEFELYDKQKALELLSRRYPDFSQKFEHDHKGEIVLKSSKMDDDYYKSMLESHTNISLNGDDDAEEPQN